MSLLFSRTAAAVFILFSLLSPLAFGKSFESMAIMGDAGKSGSELDRLKRSIQLENVKSLIMPGDNLYGGSYASVWDSWKNDGFLFDVVAIGNHTGGYREEIQYFSMPSEYYSIVHQGARFIVLNSDNERTTSAQLRWLESQLNQVAEKLVFLVFHHPTFTISKSHTWIEKDEFQNGMRQIFRTHGSKITALLLGHDHMSSFLTFGNIPVVVAGGGRSVRNESPVSYFEDGFQIQTQYLSPRTQHWALLEMDANAESASIHFVRVQDQARVCTALLAPNTFQLEKNCAR